MPRTPFVWSGVIAAALCGCEDESPPDSPETPVCIGDYSQLPATAVSLERDLMPIFGASCTFSSCHDRSAKKAGLVLGDPKSLNPDGGSCFDEAAQWGCTIPLPIDPSLLKEVRESLLAPSTTVKTPGVPRVTPRDPSKSFLLDKLTGKQDGRGYVCQSQEPSPASPDSCGGPMPFGDEKFCANSPKKVEAIAEWIRDGAEQN